MRPSADGFRRAVEAAYGYLVALDPSDAPATECGCCGFDSVLTFPVKLLTVGGVSDFGCVARCVRCLDVACACGGSR